MDRQTLGKKGEAVAAKYYLNRGFQLLAHNYRTRMGELDLVMSQGETVVIVEVKTRTHPDRMRPAEAVDPAKQQRLILAAKRFLQQHHLADRSIRFDVVEVTPKTDGWQIHCIQNAFEV